MKTLQMAMLRKQSWRIGLMSLLGAVCLTSWSQSLTWLGVLPGGNESQAYNVSDDGSVVVVTPSSVATPIST